MFEFFLALFGGGYYVTKFITESAKDRAADKQISDRRAYINQMKSKLVNDDLEISLKNDYFVSEHKDDILNELKNDLKYIYGDSWADKVQPYPKAPPGRTYYLKSDRRWIFYLLLSKRGLVPSLDYIGGYELGHLHNVKEEIRFCECIEKNLRNAGHDINLALDTSFDYSQKTLMGGLVRLDFLIQDKSKAMRLW